MDTKFLIQVIRDLHDNIVEDVPRDSWTSQLSTAVRLAIPSMGSCVLVYSTQHKKHLTGRMDAMRAAG
jgi:hypothetical protein